MDNSAIMCDQVIESYNEETKTNNMYMKKDYVWNPATYSCKNGKYLASIIDNSTIMCDEVIQSYSEETKTIPTNFDENKATCKT